MSCVVGDVGAQVVERVADLADDVAHVVAELLERGVHRAPSPCRRLHDAVELERQVGERLADAVVEVAGDAGALLVGADGAQAAEPAGVVDGQRRRARRSRRSSSTSRSVKWSGRLVLEGDQADDRCAGAERRRCPTVRAGAEARPARSTTGRRSAQAARVERAAARAAAGGPRRGCVGAGRTPSALPTTSSSRRSSSSSSTRGVEVEQVAEPRDRRVEHLVEVERRRQGLGDPVEREEQGVGVGEPAEAVEGERVLAVGLAGDAAGVAGDQRDEQQLDRPLRRCERRS